VVALTFECDLYELFRPVLDAAWRASGYDGSIFYEGSAWVGLARNIPMAS
jgi:hypothetical protein